MLACCSGCDLLYPHEVGRAPTADRGAERDAPRVDAETPPDAGSSPAEAGALDRRAAEGSPDQGSAGACAAGASLVPWRDDVVACAAGGGTDQCTASSYCNEPAGWRLCSTSEYLVRGGAAAPPPFGGTYWLAGCVRQGGDAVTSPIDAVCGGGCTSQPATPTATAWECAVGPTAGGGSTQAFVGVASHSVCRRAGADDAAFEGFWVALDELAARDGALCCR